MGLRTAPAISKVTITESPLYKIMGQGLTDRIILIGHGDGLSLNNPYPVTSVKDALDVLGRNTESPLVRGLMQAYFAGARDLWLVASAPMSEYEPDVTLRDTAYYQTYSARLDTTYTLMEEWGMGQYVVPLDAPFNSTVDFLVPLVNHCVKVYRQSGLLRIGLLGTRGTILPSSIDALTNDPRLDVLGDAGKFVCVFVGDIVFSSQEFPLVHTSGVNALAAGQLSRLPLDRGLTYQRLSNVVSPGQPDFMEDDIRRLTESGLNPVIRTTIGKRGRPYETVIATDNTLAPDDFTNAFWSLPQMRLVVVVTTYIQGLARREVGRVTYDLLKNDVEKYLVALVSNGLIRSYLLDMKRDPRERNKVIINLVLQPYFGIREITIDLKIGPQV